MTLQIGILLGSVRNNGNHDGIAQWVQRQLLLVSEKDGTELEAPIIPLNQYPLPLGPVYDDIIPQALKGEPSPQDDGTLVYPYPSERDRDFSTIIQKLHGLIIVTPQYNWSIPGELKNTIDHLFHEWASLPIGVVTYGGRGGNQCAEALKVIIKAIRAEEISVGKMMIRLPRDTHIEGDQRIKAQDEMLKEYDDVVKEELFKVVEAAQKRKNDRPT